MRRLLVLLLSLVSVGWAQAISYTVQVAAVSDETQALRLRGELAAQGFPAYLLTVPTSEGLVYRLRVGAFADRAAAARFAAAMPNVGGSAPTPALAESIPAGLIPLEPELLGAYDLKEITVQVLPWQRGLAVRSQPVGLGGQALYTLVLPDGLLEFGAWRAAPGENGGFTRVYSLPLWSTDWRERSAAERDTYLQTVLANIAADFDLTAAQVAAFTFTEASEIPFLVLVEHTDETGETTRLRALGQPGKGLTPAGPELQWFQEEQVSIPPLTPLFVPKGADDLQERVAGEGWEASASGGYTELRLPTSSNAWRAVAGLPLWARQNLLLTADGGEVLIYHFVER